jgi:type IV pilus assembly protein PilB
MTATNNSLIDCLRRIRPIDPDIFEEAQKEAEVTHVPLEQLLLQQGVASDSDLVLATADYLEIRPIPLANFSPDPALIELIPKDKWKEFKALPISRLGSRLSIAMADPFNIVERDSIASMTNTELVPMVALESEISEILKTLTDEPAQALEDILKDMADEGDVELGQDGIDDADLENLGEDAEDAPVIRIVNSILIEALRKHASDIHIEPMEKIFMNPQAHLKTCRTQSLPA